MNPTGSWTSTSDTYSNGPRHVPSPCRTTVPGVYAIGGSFTGDGWGDRWYTLPGVWRSNASCDRAQFYSATNASKRRCCAAGGRARGHTATLSARCICSCPPFSLGRPAGFDIEDGPRASEQRHNAPS